MFHDSFYFFVWCHLDLASVEKLGVEWRESNFLRTTRLRVLRQKGRNAPQGNASAHDRGLFGWGGPLDVARVAVLPNGAAAYGRSSSKLQPGMDPPWRLVPADRRPEGRQDRGRSSALGFHFWDLVTRRTEVAASPLLLLRFPGLDGASPSGLANQVRTIKSCHRSSRGNS